MEASGAEKEILVDFLAVEVLSVNFCFTQLASAPSGK
jgi:hypothetical protein